MVAFWQGATSGCIGMPSTSTTPFANQPSVANQTAIRALACLAIIDILGV